MQREPTQRHMPDTMRDIAPWPGAWPLARMVAGLLIWALSFVVLYGAMSLACTYTTPPASGYAGWHAINGWLAVLWLLHLAPLTWLTWYSWRSSRASSTALPAVRFARRVTWLCNLAALFATVWVGAPVVLLTPCV